MQSGAHHAANPRTANDNDASAMAASTTDGLDSTLPHILPRTDKDARMNGSNDNSSNNPNSSDARPSSSASRDKTTSVATPASKQPNRLPACEACRTRKIKCDALVPACTPCKKAGRECIGRDKSSSISRGLIWELQEKVRELEHKLSTATSTAPPALQHLVSYDGALPASTGGPPGRRGSQSQHSFAASASASATSRTIKRRRTEGQACSEDTDTTADGGLRDDGLRTSSAEPPNLSPSLQPCPNDFIQETSTILETLSSNLPAGTVRHPREQRRSVASSNGAASALDGSRAGPSRAPGVSGSAAGAASSSAPECRLAPQWWDDAGRGKRGAGLKASSSSPTFNIASYDREFIDRLVKRYITYMNGALPVINEVRLKETTDRVYKADLALCLTGRSSAKKVKAADRYTVLMVLAIALASLSRSHHFSSELRRLGNKLWGEAQKLLPEFKAADLDKMRAVLLQLLYAFLVPKAGSVWELSGAAMRLLTELNLHFDREADSVTHHKYDPEMLDTRRRLFWTAYCLDRSLAVALGRPPGLSDAWIHVQLPSLRSDLDLIQCSSPGSATSASGFGSRVDRLKQSFRSHIALRRIQSEIHCRLHSVNPRDYSLDHDGISLSQPVPPDRNLAAVMEYGPPTPNVAWQKRMVKKLQDWRSGCGACTMDIYGFGGGAGSSSNNSGSSFSDVSVEAIPFVTVEWMELNFNLTLSLLFRPSPNNPRPDQLGLRRAFVASGEVMKLYKTMHRTSKINFPWLATHNLFISGLTYLNSLEKLTRQGVSNPTSLVDIIFNVQSCTSVLEALTSLEDGYSTRVRDTFDAAAAAVLKTILEPSRASEGQANGNGVGTVLESTVSGALTSMPNPLRTMMGDGGIVGAGMGGGNSNGGMVGAASHHGGFDASSLRGARQGSPALRTFPAPPLQHTNNSFMSPTWLSDATWNTVTSSNSVPPGSTILVAAPPRGMFSQLQRPASSLSPVNALSGIHSSPAISSSRTTAQGSPPLQPTTGYGHDDGGGGGGFSISHHSHHPFSTTSSLSAAVLGSISPSTSQRNRQDGNTLADGSGNQSQHAGTTSGVTDNGPTFGFHNWLLQPYEGGGWGLDSTSSFLGTDAGISPSSTRGSGDGGGGHPFLSDGSASGCLGGFSDGTSSASVGTEMRSSGAGGAGGYDFDSVFTTSSSAVEGTMQSQDSGDAQQLKSEPHGGRTSKEHSTLGCAKMDEGGGSAASAETRNSDTSFLEMLADVSRSL